MFLMNCWYVAAWSQEVEEGQLFRQTIVGEPVVLFRGEDGEPKALLDQCPHRGAPLSLGRIIDRQVIECPYHGLRFDDEGKCVFNPHSERIPAAAKVKSYHVVDKHTMLWIWMGDAPPDPSAIPDYSVFDEGSGYAIGKRDCIQLTVNYRLMTDNLLDLSHVSFLHDGILGHRDMARGELSVEHTDTMVLAKRLTRNVRPPGMFDLMYRRDNEFVDTWANMRWSMPSNLLNDAGVCPVGGTRDAGVHLYGAHLLTPVGEMATTYRFAAAKPESNAAHMSGTNEEEITQKLSELRRYAFESQDEPMVLAQQSAHLRAGGIGSFKPVLLSIDAGPERARRLLDERMAAESVKA